MADNHTMAGDSAGDGRGVSPREPEAAEGAGDSVVQVYPTTPINGNALDRKMSEDMGRDDAFVDCPDEIENSDSQHTTEEKDNQSDDKSNESNSAINVQELVAEIERLRDMHENDVAEKERLAQEYEEEKAVIVRELTHLSYQLKVPNEQQGMPGENVNGMSDHQGLAWDKMTLGSGVSLHEIISECSRLIKNVTEDHIRAEEKVRELDSTLYGKNHEIDLLNTKVAELSESVSTSKGENVSQLYEVQRIEEIVNRILAAPDMMHLQNDQSDGSLVEKISNIEKFVTVLVEMHNSFVSESHQLRGVFSEFGLELSMIDEIGIFAVARDKILELGHNEQDLHYRLSILGDENRKLIEQLEKQRSVLENMNSEIERLRAEVAEEKNRYANTKEKLSMAVTKGKALVQHRDSLKQLLAEKSNELEKCKVELQEKSAALEAAEKTKELVERTEEFAASLQESLSERDSMLKTCEGILLESLATEDPQLTDITEKLRWLADESKSLKAVSLQYHKVSDALLPLDFPETVASSELDVRVRWLAESFYLSKEETSRLQSDIAKTNDAANQEIDHLTTSLLSEIQEKSYLQAELQDLRNKYEARERLQHELAEGREALSNEIDNLTKSISAESQEKSHLQLELENLRKNFVDVAQKEHLASLEKHKILSMLQEASGLATASQEEVNPEQFDMASIINNCFAKIKEDSYRSELSTIDVEILERFKNLLYITDQEMTLYKLIVEEDIMARAHASSLANELEMMTQELNTLKDEKSSMQKSLDQLEDRCALLKEKLSMAVKKGKGLVQERETMKAALNDKNSEIDRLKSELQQVLSKSMEYQDQVTKLSLDLERITLLEAEIVSAKDRGDQFEQFLAESNRMLQRVMEYIEAISTPAGVSLEDPVEKIKWIAEYLNKFEISKMEMDQELSKLKDEASSLFNKLSEAETALESLKDALSMAETSKSLLLDEKKELEVSMVLLEEKFQKEKEKASSYLSQFEELSANLRKLEDALSLAEDNVSRSMKERDIADESRALAEDQLQQLKGALREETEKALSHVSKLEELFASKRALEDALSQAEDNVSRLMNERDIAVESRVLAEEQMQKLKEELSDHITKLAHTDETIRSLEDALDQSKKNVSLLTEENTKVQLGRVDFDSELKNLKEEAESYASKFSDASLKIKSLEGELKNAENNMADLVEEKKIAEQEILALTSQLKSCSEELAETRGSFENRSLELSGQLSCLHLVLKDETPASLLAECFERKFETLSSMNSLLSEMWEYILEMDSNSPILEDDSSISTLPSRPDTTLSLEMLNNDVNAVDSESILSHIEKLNDGFHLKSKILAEKFDILSSCMDESVASLLGRLHRTKDGIKSIMKYIKDLEQQVTDMEKDKQGQEDTLASLQGDIRILSSACTDATHRLEVNVQKNVSELRSILELVKLDAIMSTNFGTVEDSADAAVAPDSSKTAEKLLLATRQNQDLSKLFQALINKLESITGDMQEKLRESQATCEDMQGKLRESQATCEDMQEKLRESQLTCEDMQENLRESQETCDEVSRERNLYKDRISRLEGDLKAQQNFCDEMTAKLNDYNEKEDGLRVRERELSTSMSKVHEFEGLPLSASQVKLILDKMDKVEILDTDFLFQDSHDSANVRKLFHVLERFSASQQEVRILSHENEELQSMIDTQILEIETLKKQVKDQLDNKNDPKNLNKLMELESGLQNIVEKLQGNDLTIDVKAEGEKQLLPLLDKLFNTTILESESLKAKNEELSAKLLGTQKVAEDLSTKIKILEESNQPRAVQPEIAQTAGTSLSAQSEISELHDVATHGINNNIPPVPSAAHVRTLRKGSNDHLALTIDSDSERLVDNKESVDDKGHVFKSLNTSGLIPRQGRTFADRVDGVWVSGSRALMSHPRGRLGLIAYWVVLHMWLLGTIL